MLRLDDLRGHPAILAFYPADWSPVCSDQMSLYQEVKPLFDAYMHWSEVSSPARNPGADGILRALDDMPGTQVPSWA